ncbi:helix-turn-helix transcriptional regulator [Pseudomonas sp. LS44]|uniref:helix-turn-helix domain-containing protein n=1 Tax=Pseudomonas sp. LS44 TaxID=1357074 RepID=UPI00215AE6B0|nr:helix-turn-helix transcriptional regulator [Pseudomonas sp. LS44]UVE16561.1 helix-turn-helix transcriptional regulator [Pseudomonas sp. LS44]
MNVQMIMRDGEPEYAVLPWAEYQALLQAAGKGSKAATVVATVRCGLDQLTRLREEKGLTLEQLAKAVGVSPPYLAMIERGERQPDAAIQRALAWNLGVDGWGEEV